MGGAGRGPVGPVRNRSLRNRAAAAALIAAALLASGCASAVDGTGVAAPGEVSAYAAERSEREAAAIRRQAVELCRQATSSSVVMLNGYNVLLKRLNEVHNYREAGDLGNKARASLIAGSDQIRAKITPTTPPDVVAPANRFLDTTGRLGAAIGRSELGKLNPIANQWTGDKLALLNACTVYLPLPPANPVPSGPPPPPTS